MEHEKSPGSLCLCEITPVIRKMFSSRLPENGPTGHRQFSSYNTPQMSLKKEIFRSDYNLYDMPALQEKCFSNPNFVNRTNPKVHKRQNLTGNSSIFENCLGFASQICSEEEPMKKQASPTKETIAVQKDAPLEEMYRNNGSHKKEPGTKKTSKQSLSAKYKQDKHSNNNKLRMDWLNNIANEIEMDESPSIAIDSDEEDLTSATPEVIASNQMITSPICITIGTPTCETAMVLSVSNTLPQRHYRLPSECESDDSFIVFECGDENDDDEEEDEDNSSEASETEHEEIDESCSDIDEVDFIRYNYENKTDESCRRSPSKKVPVFH